MFQRLPGSGVRGGCLAILGVAAVAWSCATGEAEGPGSGTDAPDAGGPDVVGADAPGAGDASARDAAPAPVNGDDAATDDAGGGDDAATGDDGNAPDAAGTDDASLDARADGADGAIHDAGAPDGAHADSGPRDAGPVDSGPDASAHDSGAADASDAGCGTGSVVVNEVQTSGTGGLDDEWVELFNPQSCPVDISGWTLRHTSATGTSASTVFTAGAGTTLGAKGYGVVAGMTYSAAAATIGAFNSGVLSDTGGGLGLYDGSALVDSMGYGAGATNPFVQGSPAPSEGSGQSIARVPNGTASGNNASDFKASTPTPGAAN